MLLLIPIFFGVYLLWCLCTGSIYVGRIGGGASTRIDRSDNPKAFWWFFVGLFFMVAMMFWAWHHARAGS